MFGQTDQCRYPLRAACALYALSIPLLVERLALSSYSDITVMGKIDDGDDLMIELATFGRSLIRRSVQGG